MLDYQVTTWDFLHVLHTRVGTKMDQNANFMVKSPFDISKAVNEKSKGSKIGMKCKNVLIGDVESCWNTARKILIMFNECFCNNHPANDVQIKIFNTFSLAQSCSLWLKKGKYYLTTCVTACVGYIDVGDGQMLETFYDNDNFETLVTESVHLKSHQHDKKVTNIIIVSPTS